MCVAHNDAPPASRLRYGLATVVATVTPGRDGWIFRPSRGGPRSIRHGCQRIQHLPSPANDRTALPRCDENRPQLCTAVDAAQITKEIKCWSRQYNQPIRARLADHPGSARYIARGGS